MLHETSWMLDERDCIGRTIRSAFVNRDFEQEKKNLYLIYSHLLEEIGYL